MAVAHATNIANRLGIAGLPITTGTALKSQSTPRRGPISTKRPFAQVPAVPTIVVNSSETTVEPSIVSSSTPEAPKLAPLPVPSTLTWVHIATTEPDTVVSLLRGHPNTVRSWTVENPGVSPMPAEIANPPQQNVVPPIANLKDVFRRPQCSSPVMNGAPPARVSRAEERSGTKIVSKSISLGRGTPGMVPDDPQPTNNEATKSGKEIVPLEPNMLIAPSRIDAMVSNAVAGRRMMAGTPERRPEGGADWPGDSYAIVEGARDEIFTDRGAHNPSQLQERMLLESAKSLRSQAHDSTCPTQLTEDFINMATGHMRNPVLNQLGPSPLDAQIAAASAEARPCGGPVRRAIAPGGTGARPLEDAVAMASQLVARTVTPGEYDREMSQRALDVALADSRGPTPQGSSLSRPTSSALRPSSRGYDVPALISGSESDNIPGAPAMQELLETTNTRLCSPSPGPPATNPGLDDLINNARRSLRGDLIHELARESAHGRVNASSPVRVIPVKVEKPVRQAPPASVRQTAGAITPGGVLRIGSPHAVSARHRITGHDPPPSVYTGHRSATPSVQGVIAMAKDEIHMQKAPYQQTPITINANAHTNGEVISNDPTLTDLLTSVNPYAESPIPSFNDLLEAANVHVPRATPPSVREAVESDAGFTPEPTRVGRTSERTLRYRSESPAGEVFDVKTGDPKNVNDALRAASSAARQACTPRRSRATPPRHQVGGAAIGVGGGKNVFSDF